MSARRIPINPSVRIRYEDASHGDAGALVFEFLGLSDEAVTRLRCEPFVKRTGNPVVRLAGATVSRNEIFEARKALIEALDSLEHAWVEHAWTNTAAMEAEIIKAVEAGQRCFNQLVGLRPGNVRLSPDRLSSYNLPKLLKELFTHVVTSSREAPIIIIEGKPASDVPWQAIPLVGLISSGATGLVSSFDGFLGTHYVIQRKSVDTGPVANLTIENRDSPVRMKFFQNRSLKACNKEVDFLRRFESESRLDLQGTPWPKDRHQPEEYVRLAINHKTIIASDGAIIEGEPDHLHHYSCHHEFRPPSEGLSPQSTLYLQGDGSANELPVSVEHVSRELQNADPGCLLAFLNACETGRDANLHNELNGIRGWMLRRLYFAAVIASETRIKDSSCGELSVSFYRHFFGGEDSAHALFRAIGEAAMRGDPTCLLFALHGDGRVRIRKPFELAA